MKAIFFFSLLGMIAIPPDLTGQTQVSGTITANTTWSAGTAYQLTGNVIVRNNAVLTVQDNVTIDLGTYAITVGSSTAGTLNASRATFSSGSSTNRKILFQDGGGGVINRCTFNNVWADIDADASPDIELTNNVFSNVLYPVTADINRIPLLTGNDGSPALIGLSGTVTENRTVPRLQWNYILTGTILVRNGATLTMGGSITMDLNTFGLTIGNTTAGSLSADGVTITGAGTADKLISFRDGSTGTVSGCTLDNVSIDIAPDAGPGIVIRDNTFRNVRFPVSLEPACVPVLESNTGNVSLIGLSGVVTANATLPKLEWDYMLTSDLTIRGNAVLTVAEDVAIDLGTSLIRCGSSTSGQLIAGRVTFRATGSGDKYILFADEGKGSLDECLFSNVYVSIDDDAGTPVYITNNSFEQVQYPVKMNPARPPVLSGNSCDAPWIALKGTLKENSSLPPYQWNFILAESVTVRDAAILTLYPGVSICLNNKVLYIGSSSSNLGNLQSDGARFYDLPGRSGKVWFRANSTGTLTHSNFEQCRLYLEGGSPQVTSCRFYHCETAVYATGTANPVFHQNDFFNNGIAFDHRGTLTINAENNFWSDPSGPQHTLNPGGRGEVVNGNVDFQPFLGTPSTGTANAVLEPEGVLFGDMVTGVRRDSSFLIRNTGDIDLMISDIHASSSSLSVETADNFWILPDSSVRIPFSYTPLQPGSQRDTIRLTAGAGTSPVLNFTVEAVGRIEGISLNFYHIDVDSFPVVRCHFSVTDQAGLPIRALVKSNVGVSEQNLNIPDFQLLGRSENGAIRVALVTDRSGSMSGKKLRDAKSAAVDFIRQLSPMDQAALLSFSNSATLNLGFTADQVALAAAVNALKSDGSTALFDAMWLAIDLVKDQPGIRAVLALTDGEDNRSVRNPSDIINYANQCGVNLYTIGLGEESDPTMRMIALQTGGQFFYSPTSDQLALIYRMISGQLQNLYIARYLASETLPFPRKVELRVQVFSQADTAIRYYNMGGSAIDFAGSGQPFRREDLSTESKFYFYYYVHDETHTIPEGLSFNYYMESAGQTIPCGGEYLGKGIMQFWADFRGVEQPGSYPVTIPDSVDQSGGYLKFNSKPGPFMAVLDKRDITQSVDIFAGGSLGVKAMKGALGLGPSVAIASVTASGTAGMGLNFERDGLGNESVTRRLEAGYGVKAESPSVGTVIDAVSAGVSAEVTIKGTVGQTLLFDGAYPDQNLMLKAKAAYILETLSFGGMVVSPFFGVVLTAVQSALVAANPDVQEIYSDLFDSWNLGASVEGKVGAEFKVKPASSSGLPEFTFAEASAALGLSGTLTHFVQSGGLGFGLALALTYDLALINLEVGNVKLGSIFKYKHGAEVSIGSEYSFADGLTGFDMSYLAYNSLSLNLLQGYYGNLYTVDVPRPVINRAVAAGGNIICDVGKILNGGNIPGLRAGAGYFSNAMDAFFGFNDDTLGLAGNHISIQTAEEFSKGLNTDIKIGLDAALGVGLGLEFGVNFTCLDKLSSLTGEYVIAHGKLLPTAEYPGVLEQDNLFSIKDELTDLFDGVIGLVSDALKNLVLVGDFLIDAGIEFIGDLPDYGGQLLGTLEDGGKVVIRAVDPRNWWNMGSPFGDPRLVRAYVSPRVSNAGATPLKSGNAGTSTLYLVSRAYNVTLFYPLQQPVEEFSPLRLKAAIDAQMMQDLEFGPDEKAMAKIYFYNTGDMSWTPVSDDLEQHPDSVGADITRSGTYAIGIGISPMNDHAAPEIGEHYPLEGGTLSTGEQIRARLTDGRTGTGIDFGHTSLLVDGIERDATWDPVNSVIAWTPVPPLSAGPHTYVVHAADNRGNVNELSITFTVSSTGISELPAGSDGFTVYPNPADREVRIEFATTGITNCDVAVYNTSGAKVASVFSGPTRNGMNRFTWLGQINDGRMAGPGLYFVRVRTTDWVKVKKLVVR